MTIAYVFVTILGLGGWIAARRFYIAARRTERLRWALNFVMVIVLLIGATGLAIGIGNSGILGAFVAFGVTGLIALAFAFGAWFQASLTRLAIDKLDARLRDDPELERKLRKNSFMRRILRD